MNWPAVGRVLAALGLALAVALVPSVASWAAPSPSPSPTTTTDPAPDSGGDDVDTLNEPTETVTVTETAEPEPAATCGVEGSPPCSVQLDPSAEQLEADGDYRNAVVLALGLLVLVAFLGLLGSWGRGR